MRDRRFYAVTEPLVGLLRSHGIGTTRTIRNTIKSRGSAKRSQIPKCIQCCLMKPAPFEYARPADLDQACAMLAAGDDARIIAGGQTLVPLMSMRLARPEPLIDHTPLSDLSFVRHEREGVPIGATT